MRKTALVLLFVVLYALVTFFGLGPVLLADGSATERVWTLAVVIAIYAVLTALLLLLLRRRKGR
ncbi:DUF6954 family protein [Paenibacillus flagellatus]|uniref:Uncharacterized protein n=1 Tax=Paenibacillus flagellatus TaxID=2211139 RepID=A0A2V5K8T3_9BACL|nr:hypothetical protein [Paenibacillus flagellatus]PYI54223.1 hypothetical protein DLM86_12065 [Paenibacillus flagellatus]